MTNLARIAAELRDGDHFKILGSDTWHSVREFRTTQKEDPMNPLNIYEQPISEIRTAERRNNPLTPFAEAWEERGLAAMQATRAALDADPPALAHLSTAEELANYSAPDSYAEGIKLLREKKEK